MRLDVVALIAAITGFATAIGNIVTMWKAASQTDTLVESLNGHAKISAESIASMKTLFSENQSLIGRMLDKLH